MLRLSCLVVGAGLFLGACSGDDDKNTGPTGPEACEGGCSAGQVCVEGECRTACSQTEPCDDGDVCREDACHPVICGDGFTDEAEECDDGSRNGDDRACTSDCLDASCGDGLIRSGQEDCDEGADNSDDGACTTECREASCGDGLVWAGEEECDEGTGNADDGACTSECTPARCGDGLVWAGQEECDDGNENLNDTCPDGPEGTCEIGPEPATALGWHQGTHTNTTEITATWIASTSPDRAAQELQLFSDDSCTTASGDPVPLSSANTANTQIQVGGEGTYTFQITTRDDSGKETTSACSPPIVVDTTPPA